MEMGGVEPPSGGVGKRVYARRQLENRSLQYARCHGLRGGCFLWRRQRAEASTPPQPDEGREPSHYRASCAAPCGQLGDRNGEILHLER